MSAAGLYFHPMDPRAQERALGLCVAASLLLHAALLFLLPGMREGGRSAPAVQILTATLGPRSAAPVPVPPKEIQPPAPKPEPQRPQARPDAPRPVLTAPANTPAPPAPVAPPPVAASPSAPPVAASPPPAAPRAPEPPASAQIATAPASSPSDALDAGSLDKYRLDVITASRQFKRYPAAAMEKGWQGKVEVRLVIAANGLTKASSIKTSSGYAILDDAARAMVTNGRNRVQIPPALRGKEFVVDVPVIFDLQNG